MSGDRARKASETSPEVRDGGRGGSWPSARAGRGGGAVSDSSFRGVWIGAALWKDPNLSHTEKFLVAEIDALTTEKKPCFAGNKFLSDSIGVSMGRVGHLLAALHQRGVLIRVSFDGKTVGRVVVSSLSQHPERSQQLITRIVENDKPHASSFAENSKPQPSFAENSKAENGEKQCALQDAGAQEVTENSFVENSKAHVLSLAENSKAEALSFAENSKHRDLRERERITHARDAGQAGALPHLFSVTESESQTSHSSGPPPIHSNGASNATLDRHSRASVATRCRNSRVKSAKVPCELPSLDEFVEFALSRKIGESDAKEQFEEWQLNGGHDGAGNPILSWKGKLVAFKNSANLPSDKRARRNCSSNHQQPAKKITPFEKYQQA
jgi:hypothetical protein